jgi:putative tricarboxylic transport membrane protein
MVDVLQQFAGGIAACFQPPNLLALVAGLIAGMLVAVLPGLTAVMGIVLVLPFTFGMPIAPAIILLSAMYISGTYGGAFTSILFRIPGEPLDVPLLWDGYAMAQKGQPAKALGWTMFAAVVGGVVSIVLAVLLARYFAAFGLRFDAPEYFALLVFALTSVVALGGTSLVNSLISLCIGLMIATVGVDVVYGVDRFSFGVPMLGDGIEYLTVMVGAYGLGEVLVRLEQRFRSRPLAKSGALRSAWFSGPSPVPARPSHPSSRTGPRASTASAERSSARESRKGSWRPRQRRPPPLPPRWCRC